MGAAVPLLVAGTTGYSFLEGRKQRKAAEKESEKMKADADAKNAEYLAKQENDRKKRATISMGLRKSLLNSAQGGGDRGGTIFTSPLGVPGGSSGAQKTLLGA